MKGNECWSTSFPFVIFSIVHIVLHIRNNIWPVVWTVDREADFCSLPTSTTWLEQKCSDTLQFHYKLLWVYLQRYVTAAMRSVGRSNVVMVPKIGHDCCHVFDKTRDFVFQIKIYRTIILPVVLYGCETWWLTLREEHRLRVFENRVLRRIFGPNRDGVTGEWRKLH